MSVPVDLPDLPAALARFDFAYLLTTPPDGAPHATACVPRWSDGVLHVAGAGRRTRANVGHRVAVGLVWPPGSPDGHSLIVDGEAAIDGEALRITPLRAVLHRPPASGDAVGSHCEPRGA